MYEFSSKDRGRREERIGDERVRVEEQVSVQASGISAPPGRPEL
jgi:hypothetical protein